MSFVCRVRRNSAFRLLLAACAALLATASAASAATFTSFSPPLTGASDYATGFPVNGLGPAGVLNDGNNFFATTPFSSQQLFKFPESGGSAATAQSTTNGFFGIGLSHGVYYGVVGTQVNSFDPATLASGPISITIPCSGQDIAPDPISTDLYVSCGNGIVRIQNPTSATPIVTMFTAGSNFDGIKWTGDGQHLWGSNLSLFQVQEFSRAGVVEASIPWTHGPDGIATAPPGAVENGINVSNNVFVNNNDGTITRIDTNNGDALSTVASGGSRGDLTTVGPDGCWYVTQLDRVEKMSPCFFQSSISPPPTTSGGGGGGQPTFLKSGAFVIGDGNAKSGSSVTFWGAQWAGRNSLSGGGAPPSFKGFADATSSNPPQCGGTFSTRPGNSSKPPSSIPPEMAVIVASSVHKHGSSITGTIAHIVDVKTNSGYAPNPGHAGTGTVTHTVC